MQIEKNVDLTNCTTYHVPAKAEFFVETKNSEELVEALNFAKEQGLPYFVLGGGSNVLFAQDFAGLVIKNGSENVEESGFSLPKLAQELVKENVKFAENLAGIPGTVGGAVRGNAGTKMGDISQIIKSVTVWRNGEILEIPVKKCGFAYRESIFKQNGDVILAVEFSLEKAEYDVREKFLENLEKRKNQPVGFSCGSFFKNPEGASAGKLVEDCGLKGKEMGGAQISPLHGNWIMNAKKATAEDVLKLARLAQNEVEKRFGIMLEPEVEIIA